jgi:hypothetical protein
MFKTILSYEVKIILYKKYRKRVYILHREFIYELRGLSTPVSFNTSCYRKQEVLKYVKYENVLDLEWSNKCIDFTMCVFFCVCIFVDLNFEDGFR